MKKNRNIALVGYKGSGKDTVVGKTLIDEYGYVRYALGDPIKEACRAIFDFNDEQLYGSEKDVMDPYWGIVPRDTFLSIGTDIMDDIIDSIPGLRKKVGDTRLWIKTMEKKMSNESKPIVVTDCRFLKEEKMLRELGFEFWRVYRPSAAEDILNHQSEMEMKDIKTDHVIYNKDGEQDKAISQVRELIEM